jgi:hypothetical protein
MQKTSFQDGTLYLDKAIDDAGFLPNIKARELIRADIEANYSSQYLAAVLREVVNRHAHLLVKKSVESVPVAVPPAPVIDVIKIVQANFPDVNLLDSNFNVALLAEHLDAFAGGQVTVTTLRAAIRLLYEKLEKYPPPVAPPPPPPEPTPEVLKILADGSRQLSINATDADLRDPAVTKLQLRDWLRRKDDKKCGGFDGRL